MNLSSLPLSYPCNFQWGSPYKLRAQLQSYNLTTNITYMQALSLTKFKTILNYSQLEEFECNYLLMQIFFAEKDHE